MEKRATAYIQALAGIYKPDRAEVIFNPAEYSLERRKEFRWYLTTRAGR